MVKVPPPGTGGPTSKYNLDTVTVDKPLVIKGLSSDECERIRWAATSLGKKKRFSGQYRFPVRKVPNGDGGFTVTVYKEAVK